MSAPVLSTATLALEDLFAKVQAGLHLRVPAPHTPQVVFGWREAPKQINQGPNGASRVVIQPGDASGKLGTLGPGKLPGKNPDSLATLFELATLWLWAWDSSDSSDLAQWRAVRRLHDLVMPIILREYRGRWAQMSADYQRPELERRFGAELQIVIAVEAVVPDDVRPEAPGNTVQHVSGTMAVNGGPPVVAC